MSGSMAQTCNVHDLTALSEAERAALLIRAEADLSPYLEKVRPIIEAVRTEGDAALARFARELDKADVAADRIVVTEAEFDAPSGRSTGRSLRRSSLPLPTSAVFTRSSGRSRCG